MREALFLASDISDPMDLPEDGWRPVTLPHQWTLDPEAKHEMPDTEEEVRTGWYRLEFPEAMGRRWVQVRADYYCQAWAGDRYQGLHEGYFEPWTIELIPKQPLLLKVSAPKEEVGQVWPRYKRQIKGVLNQHDCRPGASTPRGQEQNTGGLWWGAHYFRTGSIAMLHMRWFAIKSATGWNLEIQLELDAAVENTNDVDTENLEELSPINLALSLQPLNFDGESYQTNRTIEIKPERQEVTIVWELPEMPRWEVWERGWPHLYQLQVQLEEQTLTAEVGFRTITVEDERVVVNEAPIFLRGTNIIPTQWLAGYTNENAIQDVQLLREAHLNAVRVHAHLTHPYFYQACDRAGILVWQDFPLQWGYSTETEFAEEAILQAKAMVKHYGNHPSIYLWCAHNEPTHNRYTLDPLLSAAIKEEDPTRIVKEASDFREHPYPGWYWGDIRDFLATPGGTLPAEFGAQGLPPAEVLREALGKAAWPPQWESWVYHDFQPDQTFRVAGIDQGESLEEFVANSQEYQARLIRFAIESYRRARGKISGYFQFMFVEPWNAITWAVLDVHRQPKQSYFVLKEASSPVLLSLVPFREITTIGQPPLLEAWVINDLNRAINIRLELYLQGPRDVQLMEILRHVEAQNSRCIFQEREFNESSNRQEVKDFQDTLESLEPGPYRLIGEVWEEETLLSRNEISLEYLPPLTKMGRAW